MRRLSAFGLVVRESACVSWGRIYSLPSNNCPLRKGGRLLLKKGATHMTTVAYDSLSAADHSRELRKAVIAATVGTTIEWYDFFLYGTAAGLVFGKLYFPNSDPTTATLLAF